MQVEKSDFLPKIIDFVWKNIQNLAKFERKLHKKKQDSLILTNIFCNFI